MIDIKLIRENKDLVKQNIRKKFQDHKLSLVDEVFEIDKKYREYKSTNDELRKERNEKSSLIGELVRNKDFELVEKIKLEVQEINNKLNINEKEEFELENDIENKMMIIPNIIDESVPIGKDSNENVELERFGEVKNFNYEIPYHADILEKLNGLDKESAGKTSGNGFYYLTGDIALLHSAILSYAREFMIKKGFTYCIPPFMIRGSVVSGVMSFEEMNNMMYKIENEDLYLIGTSEHSMIGRYIDQIIEYDKAPIKMTSYSPCFRKEVGAHGIEERGIYRIHQFEKQEMIVICDPKDAMDFYNKMWNYTVEFFRTLEIPVRTLECCSGDLADLKIKSVDVEAWSPRQQKYFEVGSCSNLGEAQARRLNIKIRKDNDKYFAHTLNNTVVAPPRMLIAFIENNYNEDGSINIPEVLRPYMLNKSKISVN